jgi:hypothetical protein
MSDEKPTSELSLREFRRHPVYETLKTVGVFGENGNPSGKELDALGLPPAARRDVEKACQKCVELQGEGSQQEAWQAADQAASEIIGALPEPLQDPAYLDEAAAPDGENDPRALAARVERGTV